MSRTLRRKNVSPKGWYTEPEFLLVINGVLCSKTRWSPRFTPVWPKRCRNLSPEQYIRFRINRFHSDHYDMNAPARFRRGLTRLYRIRMQQELNESIRQDDIPGESFSNQRPMKDANWNWF